MMDWRHWVKYFERMLVAGYEARYLDNLAEQACARWPRENLQIRYGLTVLLFEEGLVRLDWPHVVFTEPAPAALGADA